MKTGGEILCSACHAESLVVREPVYEGFKKVGESFRCAACGHVYANEADVPFKERKSLGIFSEADRSATPKIFAEGENRRLCRYCAHFVVNPFTQWCGVHKKEVAATDSCAHFKQKQNALPGTDDTPSTA